MLFLATTREKELSILSPLRIRTSTPWCVAAGPEIYQQLTLGLLIFKFQYAENPETRRKAYKNYENRLQTNIPLFSQVLDLRFQIAKLLEYPTWVDYVTEANMVKSVTGVRKVCNFLQTVIINTSTDIQCPLVPR